MEPGDTTYDVDGLHAPPMHAGIPFQSPLPQIDTSYQSLLAINQSGNAGDGGAAIKELARSQKKRKKKKIKEEDEQPPPKRHRAKKPVDAPTRPKSAYMFFLAEFRAQWKEDNPDSKKVADVAKAAGEVWRDMPEAKKLEYEEKSTAAKAAYASATKDYDREHPKPARNRNVKPRDPAELKRPQSAYFFYLADFREEFKKEHPDEHLQVSVLGKLAGEKWKTMSDEHKAPYEELSKASKAEYAKQKMLTPEERRAYAAGLLVTPSMGMPQLPSAGLSNPFQHTSHPGLLSSSSQPLSHMPGMPNMQPFQTLHNPLPQAAFNTGIPSSSLPASTSFGAGMHNPPVQFQLTSSFPTHLQQFLPQLQMQLMQLQAQQAMQQQGGAAATHAHTDMASQAQGDAISQMHSAAIPQEPHPQVVVQPPVEQQQAAAEEVAAMIGTEQLAEVAAAAGVASPDGLELPGQQELSAEAAAVLQQALDDAGVQEAGATEGGVGGLTAMMVDAQGQGEGGEAGVQQSAVHADVAADVAESLKLV